MRFFTTVLFGAALALCAASPARAEKDPGLYQRIDPNVVCIRSVMADGSTLNGTGFFISEDRLATVAHQVKGAKKITLHLQDGLTGPAKLLARHDPWDIAVLQAPETRMRGLPLSAEGASLGQEVFTIGCPLGLDHSLSRGVVSNPQRQLEGKLLIQTDLTVNNGNSGGPLLDDGGRVVGVIMGSWKQGAGVNFAVPVSRLNALLEQAGIELNPLDAQLRTIAGMTDPAARLAAVRRLADDHPADPAALMRLGDMLEEGGAHEAARSALIRAIALDPESAIAYWKLGMVYATGLRNTVSARQAFLKYLELQPDGNEAPGVRAWLAANE